MCEENIIWESPLTKHSQWAPDCCSLCVRNLFSPRGAQLLDRFVCRRYRTLWRILGPKTNREASFISRGQVGLCSRGFCSWRGNYCQLFRAERASEGRVAQAAAVCLSVPGASLSLRCGSPLQGHPSGDAGLVCEPCRHSRNVKYLKVYHHLYIVFIHGETLRCFSLFGFFYSKCE